MKFCRYLTLLTWIAAVSCLVGCGGHGGGGSGAATDHVAPIPPVAEAGPAQNVTVGALVTLDGSKSTCAAGRLFTTRWSISSRPAGSAAALQLPETATPTFTPDLQGQYVVTLTVNDGSTSAQDTVLVTASRPGNALPVANAGAAQGVRVGTLATLDGSGSSDADGDLLSFSWTIGSKPTGSSAQLSDPSRVNPTFTPDLPGVYSFSLTVNDGGTTSQPAQVTVTAYLNNVPPTANAGPAQNVLVGRQVSLDGSHSSDADGDTLTYLWRFVSLPSGSTAQLSSTTTINPVFTSDLPGSYVLSLIVNDGKIDSAASSITISASQANTVPVAQAGPAQNVSVGSTVTLDASASHDADGDALSYNWAFRSKPPGSSASLSGASSVQPSFVADAAGSYLLQLVVSDGTSTSAASTVLVTAAKNNRAPVANAGADKTVPVGSSVTLDGSGSSDADGDALSYRWLMQERPAGSSASLSSPSTRNPGFLADKVGSYVFTLIVNDGTIDSSAATVTITSTDKGSLTISW